MVSCKKARGRHHRFTGFNRHSLHNGFTVSFVLSPVTGLIATVIPEKLASQELDASIGASGPHDFAVRVSAVRLRAPLASIASRDTPLASPKPARMSERAVLTKPPVAGTEPVTPQRR
jgi:hypothetical protein